MADTFVPGSTCTADRQAVRCCGANGHTALGLALINGLQAGGQGGLKGFAVLGAGLVCGDGLGDAAIMGRAIEQAIGGRDAGPAGRAR